MNKERVTDLKDTEDFVFSVGDLEGFDNFRHSREKIFGVCLVHPECSPRHRVYASVHLCEGGKPVYLQVVQGSGPTFNEAIRDAYRYAEQIKATLDRLAVVVATMRCDGKHDGPECADPECWVRDGGEVAQ